MKKMMKKIAVHAAGGCLGLVLGFAFAMSAVLPVYSNDASLESVDTVAQASKNEMSLKNLVSDDIDTGIEKSVTYNSPDAAAAARVIPIKILEKTSEEPDEETPAKRTSATQTTDDGDVSGQPAVESDHSADNTVVATTEPQAPAAPAVVTGSGVSQPAQHVTPVVTNSGNTGDVDISNIVNTVTGGNSTEDITNGQTPVPGDTPAVPTGLDDLDNGTVSSINDDGYLAE